MNENSFAKQLESLVPKSLDDLIRTNRDLALFRLATDQEVMHLHHEIAPRKPKDTLNDWRLIAFHLKQVNQTYFFMLGTSATSVPRITSDVEQIDLDRKLILTRNSLYSLGERGEGEPHFEHLMMVCSAFHTWGLGETLGMLEVFY